MKWFEAAFSEWVVKYRWWIIAATVLAVFSAASGARFLTFNNDLRVFFSEENPQLQKPLRIPTTRLTMSCS